jgi:pimeloyl-ACP methyl ester carboxylesterase
MYTDLVQKLMQLEYIPIVINTRTGISLKQNLELIKEVIQTYPPDEPKIIIAHDWGAFAAWKIMKHFNQWNIVKFICLSVGFLYKPIDCSIKYRSYQCTLFASKFFPSCISNAIQNVVVERSQRQLKYNTPRSNYYYTLKYALGYLIGRNKYFCSKETLTSCTTKILFITTQQDEKLGFASQQVYEILQNRQDQVVFLSNINHFFVHDMSFLYPIIFDFLNVLN